MNKLTAIRKLGYKLLESEIAALYRVRQAFWRLLPHADAARDYAHFAADVRRAQYTMQFCNAAGETVGGYVVEYERRTHEGRAYIAFIPRFTYMYDAYRGNKLMPRSGIVTALRIRLRHPFTPIYLLSDSLPPSYLVLVNAGSVIWTLRDETAIPNWERGIFREWAGEELPDTSPDTFGLRLEEEVPTFADATGQARLSRHPHYAAYQRLNPRWAEGYTLLIMVPMRLRKLAARLLQRKPHL